MSVINTMLKDLERRGVDCANSDDKILGGLSANSSFSSVDERTGHLYLVSIVSVILLLVIIGTAYYVSPFRLVSVANEDVVTRDVSDETAPVTPRLATAQPDTIQHRRMSDTVTPEVATVQKVIVEKQSERKIQQPAQPMVKTPAAVSVVAVTDAVQAVDKQPEIMITKSEPADSEEAVADELQVVSKTQREATDEEKSQQAYATALTLYKSGRTQRSKALLQEALNFSSSNREAYRLLGVIYLEDGRAGLAAEVIEQGLTAHNNDKELLRLYLQSLVQNRKYDEAAAVMEQRLQLTTPEDLGYLAGLYQKSNDHLSAVKFYAQALQLKPSKSIWWMGQGISFEALKKYDEAMKSYQQAISTGQLSGALAQYPVKRINSIKQFNAKSVS